VFSLSRGKDGTVTVEVGEDETQTEGRAGFAGFRHTGPGSEFLSAGPPAGLLAHTNPAELLPHAEAFVEALAGDGDDGTPPTPAWLEALRLQRAAMAGDEGGIRERLGRAPATMRVGGRDALYWAVSAKRAGAVALLLSEGRADPNATYPGVGFGPTLTPLMLAILADNGGADGPDAAAEAVLDALRAGGADPEARNDRGETALLWLLSSAHADGVWRARSFDWLLRNGADPGARLPDGRDPPALVAASRFLPAVKRDLAAKLSAAGAARRAPSSR
jgi:hypothetical protein